MNKFIRMHDRSRFFVRFDPIRWKFCFENGSNAIHLNITSVLLCLYGPTGRGIVIGFSFILIMNPVDISNVNYCLASRKPGDFTVQTKVLVFDLFILVNS